MNATRASQVALVVKNPLASAGGMRNIGSLPGWEEPLEKEMATDSRILPGETCGQRSLLGLQSDTTGAAEPSTALR